jgi:DNA-binding transcriptional ArsR family regulator
MTDVTSPSVRRDPRLAKAMSNPLRLRLLAILNEEVASPKDLAERVGEPLENVAYHVRVLRELDCIELVRTAQRRGATAHYYRATTRAFIDSEASSELDVDARSAISATILQEAFKGAFDATAAGTFDSRTDRHVTYTNLTLTDSGWRELNERLDALVEHALELQAQALSPEASDEERVCSDLIVAHFPAPRPS